MYRVRALLICIVVIASTLVSNTGVATAAVWHSYSAAYEKSAGLGYTGVAGTRADRSVSGLDMSGCSQFFVGQPVYQTEWVNISAGNWLEFGTGHQCGDTMRYWYWGYGFNNTW